MKRTFAFLLALALAASVAACGDKSDPVGSWVLDKEKAVDVGAAAMEKMIADAPEGQRKGMEAMLGATPADRRKKVAENVSKLRLELTLAADKTFKGIMKEPNSDKVDESIGSWEEKDGKIIMTMKSKNGQPPNEADAKPVQARMVAGNLAVSTGEGPDLTMKRK